VYCIISNIVKVSTFLNISDFNTSVFLAVFYALLGVAINLEEFLPKKKKTHLF